MHFQCIKTGFIALIGDGSFHAHGDAFVIWPHPSHTISDCQPMSHPVGTLLLRISAAKHQTPARRHIHVRAYDTWFDRGRSEQCDDGYEIWQPNSTLIATAGNWQWLGYDGIEL